MTDFDLYVGEEWDALLIKAFIELKNIWSAVIDVKNLSCIQQFAFVVLYGFLEELPFYRFKLQELIRSLRAEL